MKKNGKREKRTWRCK